jgi:outer membrane protein assembly factor BamB
MDKRRVTSPDNWRLSRRAALLVPTLLVPTALGGCSWFDWLTDEEKKPVPGNREPVLAPARGMRIDSVDPVTLAPLVENPAWSQYGGVVSHAGGNFAGGLTKAWSTSIGRGGDYRTRLTAQPLIVEGRVYTMDTDCVAAAFDLASGHEIWRTKTRPKKDTSSNVGGGIAIADGVLYVTSGLAEALALNLSDGGIIWRVTIPTPARSAPTVVPEGVFLTTMDQQLIGLAAKDGKFLWSYQATPANTGTLGQAAPAYADGVLVAGFESGDLAAVRADSGTLVWTDNMGGVKGSATLSEFASVRAAPVIDNGLAFAVGLGGLLAALDLRSGRRVWQRDIAGANTPCLAGDFLFLVDSDQKCGAINKNDGTVHWVEDLPRFTNPKRTKGLITWYGPTLIGGKLVLVSDKGKMGVLDPITGALVTSSDLESHASLSPVVARNTVLVLTDDAILTAYK